MGKKSGKSRKRRKGNKKRKRSWFIQQTCACHQELLCENPPSCTLEHLHAFLLAPSSHAILQFSLNSTSGRSGQYCLHTSNLFAVFFKSAAKTILNAEWQRAMLTVRTFVVQTIIRLFFDYISCQMNRKILTALRAGCHHLFLVSPVWCGSTALLPLMIAQPLQRARLSSRWQRLTHLTSTSASCTT